jgi:hypothetical protein
MPLPVSVEAVHVRLISVLDTRVATRFVGVVGNVPSYTTALVAVLLALTGSNVVVEAVAATVRVPPAVGLAGIVPVNVMSTNAPEARLARVQVTLEDPIVPQVAPPVAAMVRPLMLLPVVPFRGTVSATLSPVAVFGPLLVTLMTQLTAVPALAALSVGADWTATATSDIAATGVSSVADVAVSGQPVASGSTYAVELV